VHELCHTIHLNHSAQFWALVREKDPNYKAIDQELRRSSHYVPNWLEPHTFRE
jgi:predicted metal-dependent hydrolase